MTAQRAKTALTKKEHLHIRRQSENMENKLSNMFKKKVTRKIQDTDQDDFYEFDHNAFQAHLQQRNRNPGDSIMANR